MNNEERAWRVGADGERLVGRSLAKLPVTWRILHSVEVGDNGSDIDHVAIGPGGVFTLNTKHRPNARVWVGERMVMVNGHRTDYLRNSQFEAKRASRLLSSACGFRVPVRAGIVFVNAANLTVKQEPADVAVTTRRRVTPWLAGLPAVYTSEQIQTIFVIARSSRTWQS